MTGSVASAPKTSSLTQTLQSAAQGAMGLSTAAMGATSMINGINTMAGAAGAGGATTGGVSSSVTGAIDESLLQQQQTMLKANDAQNQMAMLSAAMQTAGLARSMMMQALRDFIKDAKDTVKDQGEAGHKP